MQDGLLAKYESRRAPRYTSYPTAQHFSPAIGPADYAEWLAALPSGADGSLYVHVPFCSSLCFYCGCHTSAAKRYEPVAAYRALLETEIGNVSRAGGEALLVRRLHWGGGSPTILRGADFLGLTRTLRDAFRFADDAEIAIEIDPRTLTPDRAQALAEAGVTRASIGAQTFDPAVQQAIGRIQSYAETKRVMDWLRGAGVTRFNVDLMYGLPHQTAENVARSAREALDLDPDRIALFGYAHVPWLKRRQTLLPVEALPDGDERARQFDAAAAVFIEAGYARIGFDHFAKPEDSLARAGSRLRRNFQGYTTDDAPALLGFGASAISTLPQGYAQNHASVPDYRKALADRRLATARGVPLTAEDRLRRDVIERVLCDMQADLGGLCARHGADVLIFEPELRAIDRLAGEGVARRRGLIVEIPEEARALARVVAAVFDARLAEATGCSTVV